MIPGRGICAQIEDKTVFAGSKSLLEEHGISLARQHETVAQDFLEQGCTVIFVAVQKIPAGLIALADTVREDAPRLIADLHGAGIQPILLTGDHAGAAGRIASTLGIADVRAGCLPEDKLNLITAYQHAGEPVCMVGDGINDAPALKKAHVSIAMGSVGSDIAVEAADIALIDDEISQLPHLMALSKRMMKTIKWNLAFSMGLNFLAIFLAITGLLGPVVGALVHNAGSVAVILNSALLLKWRKNQ